MKAEKNNKKGYTEKVEPNLEKIKEWANNGATQKQIADALGVGYSTFKRYIKERVALRDAIKKRVELVAELRGTLIKKALGYEYEETRITTTKIKIPKELREKMKDIGIDIESWEEEEITRTQKTKKWMHPDVAAINLALKNYDAGHWANDPQILEIRKKELELREKQIENNSF